jgi:hypothetical protein
MAPSKRATVPGDVFGQKGSALDKLTGRASMERGDAEGHSTTVLPQNSETVVSQASTTQDMREKVTVYLRPDQVDKLDELAREYRRHTGKRISRVEIMRRLIDASDLQMVLET